MKVSDLKAISLFAGAGGCSLGFSDAGVDIIAAYDNATPAIETYNTNFLGYRCKNVDLSSCNFSQLRDSLGLKHGELDLIIGGPPCQGFTTAGNRFWDDPRNKLVQNYANALAEFYPRWFMMENVEGILTTAKGEYIIECVKKMIELGYSVYLKKVYMQEYAVPQRRKRVIIVGNREGKCFHFPKEKQVASGSIFRQGSDTLYEAIKDLEGIDIPEIDHVRRSETGIQLERIEYLKVGQTMKDMPEQLQNASFKRRAFRRVCDGIPSAKRGGAPSGIKRLSYDEPCLTITGSSIFEFVHPVENRMLTIRECARIQTFPDKFSFCGTETQKMQQIGNAIPPRFAYQMANSILEADNTESKKEPQALISYNVTKATAKSTTLSNTCSMLDCLLPNRYKQLELMLEV